MHVNLKLFVSSSMIKSQQEDSRQIVKLSKNLADNDKKADSTPSLTVQNSLKKKMLKNKEK